MKILGFGENKKDSIEDTHSKNIAKDMDMNHEEDPENIDDNNVENNKEDDYIEEYYIDTEELDYCEYDDVIESIEEEGWIRISYSSGLYPITHFNNQIIFPKSVKRNTFETVLEIICPPGEIITICGTNHDDINKDDFFNSPNLYAIPHFLTLRLADDNNNEILPTTIIEISKIKRGGDIEKFYQEFYGDLCPTIDGRLKKKEERYYFQETIILQHGDKLVFKVYWPYTDISKIELLMMADLFKKDEE